LISTGTPYERKALPVATLWNFVDENSREITPSIYITNDVLLNSDKSQLASLAINIHKRLSTIINSTRKEIGNYSVNKYGIEADSLRDLCISEETRFFDDRIKEVLIDCDWTGKSRLWILMAKLANWLLSEFNSTSLVM